MILTVGYLSKWSYIFTCLVKTAHFPHAVMPTQAAQTEGLRRPIGLSGLLIKANSKIQVSYPWLQCRLLVWGKYQEKKALEVTRMRCDVLPSRGGPSTVAKILISDTGHSEFSVCGSKIETVECSPNGYSIDIVKLCEMLDKLGEKFVFCAGLPYDIFKSALNGIRYTPQNIEKRDYPFDRWSSKKCLVWYALRNNATHEERMEALNGCSVCSECNSTFRTLRKTNTRILEKQTLDSKKRKQAADSHSPMCWLSPSSKRQRMNNLKSQKKSNHKKLQRLTEKLAEMEISLDKEQSQQLGEFTQQVDSLEVDKVVSDIEDRDAAAGIKQAFLDDQKKSSKCIENGII